jgi:methyl-accepting chemotaxis protein
MSFFNSRKSALHRAVFDVIQQSRGILELELDATIVDANDRYLQIMGYGREELIGRKHLVTVEKSEAGLRAYEDLWLRLRAGEAMERELKRIRKDGAPCWFHVNYTHLRDGKGRPTRVVMIVADITQQKIEQLTIEARLDAVHRSSALVEFEPDGRVVTANENFLKTLGYRLDELVGQPHALFVTPEEVRLPAYAEFWSRLRRGECVSGEFHRIGKGGKEVWLQGSYNPVFGFDGTLRRVVKIASDVTDRKYCSLKRETIFKQVDARLNDVTKTVTSVAGATNAAASVSARTSGNVQAVAAGAEQLSASFHEIAQQVQQASAIAQKAVTEAGAAARLVDALALDAQKIGDVVKLIHDIAAQTNLLALNATIEAARAGEAGRGFAVVAAEVKTLATRTAKATEDIGEQVSSVRGSTQGVTRAIETIGAVIASVNDITASVSGAVQAQSEVTRDISENMQTAAHGVEAISASMQDIAQSTAEIDAATQAVRELSRSAA